MHEMYFSYYNLGNADGPIETAAVGLVGELRSLSVTHHDSAP
jgi:hypothetical protein